MVGEDIHQFLRQTEEPPIQMTSPKVNNGNERLQFDLQKLTNQVAVNTEILKQIKQLLEERIK